MVTPVHIKVELEVQFPVLVFSLCLFKLGKSSHWISFPFVYMYYYTHVQKFRPVTCIVNTYTREIQVINMIVSVTIVDIRCEGWLSYRGAVVIIYLTLVRKMWVGNTWQLE